MLDNVKGDVPGPGEPSEGGGGPAELQEWVVGQEGVAGLGGSCSVSTTSFKEVEALIGT